jgi:GNAT superfamily N-acetyltransferase
VPVAVEEIDATTAPDDVLLSIYEVEAACDVDAYGRPQRTAADAVAYFRHPPADEIRRRWLVRDGDRPVGTTALFVHGPAMVYVELLVDPAARRRGIGSALLEAVRGAAREARLASFFAHHFTPAGAAFARRVGAVDGQRDVRSELRLADARLEPRPTPGYELRSWRGAAPDDLVETYAEAHEAMNDAPAPEGLRDRPWTVARVRALEEACRRRDRELRATVAVADGAVASFTELRASAPPATDATTEDTATLAAHRGRGLARAVKCEALRLLAAERPDVERVRTLNAESNAAMRAVNRDLGFVPVATLTTTVLTL